jgi:hypothetical protein
MHYVDDYGVGSGYSHYPWEHFDHTRMMDAYEPHHFPYDSSGSHHNRSSSKKFQL